MVSFKSELESLINKYNTENGSDTPDFILAEYMLDCLAAFEKASNRRGDWYGGRQTINGILPVTP